MSFLTDVSSELTFTLMPLFLVNVLGVGPAIVGLIEGIGESTATTLRLVGGYASDRIGRRKPLTVLGYGFSALVKPALYFASTWGLALAVRFSDRLGKGMRTAPRDALVADSTPPEHRGKSFGFHRALDTYGAMVGLALAALVVFYSQRGTVELTRSTFQKLVLLGVVPAFLAVLVLLLRVKEPVRPAPNPGEGASPRAFDRRFKAFLAVMALFSLGNFSQAFLILRAQDVGLSPLHILLILVVFNLVAASFSLPAGALSDRVGRRWVMMGGWLALSLAYLGFAWASSPWLVVALFLLYALYYGAHEGVGRAWVADMVGKERRGTAYGLYHGVVGVIALPASLLAGFLWQSFGAPTPFLLGAALVGLATLLLLFRLK